MTRLSQLRSGALALFLATGSLTCGGNVEPTTPTHIASSGGNEQTGIVGSALPSPLTVLVTDASGNAVPGVSVSWAAQGGGSVSPATVETGSDGHASVTRILGPTPGEQTTIATRSGLQGSPVTFVATAIEGNPTGGIVITTNPPVAALTSEVFDPVVQPVVMVTAAGGSPAPGEEVIASIASGSGQLDGKIKDTTDANGVARFTDLGINGTGEHTLKFTAGTATVTSSPVAVAALTPKATTGEWGPLVDWGNVVPLHISLLPSGKVFAWGRNENDGITMGMPRVWDPANGPPTNLPAIPVDTMLFCAGHTLMPDGRLMVSGGHKADDMGIKATNFFSSAGSWQPGAPDMAYARWYPTTTVLPDGRVLTMGGRDENEVVVTTPEIWENGRWVALPGAGTVNIPYYPRNFVDPKNGLIFYAGERVQSRWFDFRSTGAWIPGPTHKYGFNRDYGSAVMYEPGKILVVGGGGHMGWRETPDVKAAVPTATAETIDLNATTPTWEFTESMSAPRRHLNATILPDGQVLVTGGTRGGGFVDASAGNAVRAAEVWNPATGQWRTLASNSKVRVYHSVSLLLPDGTVLHGASGYALDNNRAEIPKERNHEIFFPPYLFKGARPTMTSVSPNVGYNGTITVTTPNAAQITEVRWIRLGSVTHAFDMSQVANRLSFTQTPTGVEVTAPANPNLAPPGHYLLFILNRNGVPSAGKVVRVQ